MKKPRITIVIRGSACRKRPASAGLFHFKEVKWEINEAKCERGKLDRGMLEIAGGGKEPFEGEKPSPAPLKMWRDNTSGKKPACRKREKTRTGLFPGD
jgi:hypothetical protein